MGIDYIGLLWGQQAIWDNLYRSNGKENGNYDLEFREYGNRLL